MQSWGGSRGVEIEIIEFTGEYLEDLRRLTREWVDKYFYLEPEDEVFLANPAAKVIAPGGHIFLAKYGQEIIGTVSLLKSGEHLSELAKLAVTAKYQGLKVGRKLLEHCLQVAAREGVRTIRLDTNRKLEAAVALYRKYGFREVPLGENKYIEVDLKMELVMAAPGA